MKKTSLLVTVAASFALFTPISLFADDHEEAPPALSDVWIMVPKKGMEAEFAAGAKAHMAYRAENGDERSWDGFRVVLGDKINVIQFRSCCFDWADQDAFAEADASSDFGKHWNENVHQYVDHYHHYFDEMDWEHSHWPEGQGAGPYYGVTTWDVREGRGPESSEAQKAMSKMAKEGSWASDDNNWLWHRRIGGSDKQMIVSSYATYADMAPPEKSFYDFAVEEMGEEKAGEMFDAFGSGFTGSDYTVWVHDPEISSPEDEE
ncbi:MAG: hypothetical protein K0U72_16890 [Gammaproteobacteria bacterium]|nr:hypothetical protein [Gammaproteobacteria bacterium]